MRLTLWQTQHSDVSSSGRLGRRALSDVGRSPVSMPCQRDQIAAQSVQLSLGALNVTGETSRIVLPSATGFAARQAIAILRRRDVPIASLLNRTGVSESDIDDTQRRIGAMAQGKLLEYWRSNTSRSPAFRSRKLLGCSAMRGRPPSIMLSRAGRADRRQRREAAISVQATIKFRNWATPVSSNRKIDAADRYRDAARGPGRVINRQFDVSLAQLSHIW